MSARILGETNLTKITLYHNPRCSKSRTALRLLEDKGVAVEIVRYLEAPLTADALGQLIQKLNTSPDAVLRSNDPTFKALGRAPTDLSEADLIDLLVAHPKLLERPIAVRGKRAVIGRPPENVLSLLDQSPS